MKTAILICALFSLMLICSAADTGTTEIDCTSPAEVGRGKAAIPRYNYNTKTKECEKFIFGGGANVNNNNYETKEECETKCKK